MHIKFKHAFLLFLCLACTLTYNDTSLSIFFNFDYKKVRIKCSFALYSYDSNLSNEMFSSQLSSRFVFIVEAAAQFPCYPSLKNCFNCNLFHESVQRFSYFHFLLRMLCQHCLIIAMKCVQTSH